jgi:hypothetical protein
LKVLGRENHSVEELLHVRFGMVEKAAMQRLELSLLAKLPSSQRSLITEGQPVILEIAVAEAKDEQKRAKEDQK